MQDSNLESIDNVNAPAAVATVADMASNNATLDSKDKVRAKRLKKSEQAQEASQLFKLIEYGCTYATAGQVLGISLKQVAGHISREGDLGVYPIHTKKRLVLLSSDLPETLTSRLAEGKRDALFIVFDFDAGDGIFTIINAAEVLSRSLQVV